MLIPNILITFFYKNIAPVQILVPNFILYRKLDKNMFYNIKSNHLHTGYADVQKRAKYIVKIC